MIHRFPHKVFWISGWAVSGGILGLKPGLSLNSGTDGGGLHIGGAATQYVRNSLFWQNVASGAGDQIYVTANNAVATNTLDFDYCNLEGGAAGIEHSAFGSVIYGANNSSVYPGFVDPDGADDDLNTWEDNDVRLGPNSDARDAGDNTVVGADVLDLDGDGNTTEPVPLDLGSFVRFVDSNEPDTGNGTAPIVDLGCYED
jgi:hypothetical protein